MSAANPDDPNYLKPAPGYGLAPTAFCRHAEIVPCTDRGERAQYQCVACQHPFPQSLIEEKDGKFRMVDFSHFGNKPRKRRR